VAKYQVIFFETESGDLPARDFLDSLDTKMLANMSRTISMLQENGLALREPYSKSLDDGIFELRAQAGSNITRVLYFLYIGRRVVLTNGFIKKTQKTPESEIYKAKAFRKEYLVKEVEQNENV